jgi:hypothetical protein
MIEIRKGFENRDRSSAAGIYVNPFKRKFENLISEDV